MTPPTDATLSSLIERLEKAEAGSTTLDFEIQDALGRPPNWDDPQWPCYPITTSIDAAIALVQRVLPGWRKKIEGPDWDYSPRAKSTWTVMLKSPRGEPEYQQGQIGPIYPASKIVAGEHKDFAVASVIALLKALQAKEAGQ